MKSINTLLVVFITLFTSSQVYGQGQILGGKKSVHPDWFKESFLEIAADVEEATDENRHVMLFIHLNGCPYCYKMIEENIKNAPYTDYIREHFDVIALNMLGDREVMMDDETSLTEKELATQLKVVYTPTILFLNAENQVVARTNGYRSIPDFKLVLNYVKERAYVNLTLAQYLDQKKGKIYSFRDHPQIQDLTDLHSVADKPLAVLFEDQGCVDCDALHDGHLANPEIRKILDGFTLVRLDALSDQKITDIEGNTSTARDYAEKLGLTYRPGIVLFDQGKEIMRIQSMLYHYHFSEILRYVGERHYQKYPDDFYDYLDVRTASLLESGKDVRISE